MYAAILAARYFRVFVAIAVVFDLDMTQYNVVNAFTNARNNEMVYCGLPPGYI